MSFLDHPFQPLESPLDAPTEILLEKWMHPDDRMVGSVPKTLLSPSSLYWSPDIPLGTPAGTQGVTASIVDRPCIALARGPLLSSSTTEVFVTQQSRA